MKEIAALGELLIDFAPAGTNDMGYPVLSANPGGAPCNFLAAASMYGCSTEFIGKVGKDAFGIRLKETLEKAGIGTGGLILTEDVFTTLAFVMIGPDGDRSFSFARKPGADTQLTWEELRRDLIDDAKVFHFGTLSLTDEPARTTTKRAVEYAEKQGKLITCDPNYRAPLWKSEAEAKEQMLWAVAHADVLKISDNEVEFLWNCSPEQAIDRIFQGSRTSLVMITLGPDGCLAATRNCRVRVPGRKVHAIDTTGAGDIFGGSAVSGLLRTGKRPEDLSEQELSEIITFAVTASGLSTEKQGGIPSVPRYEDVIQAME